MRSRFYDIQAIIRYIAGVIHPFSGAENGAQIFYSAHYTFCIFQKFCKISRYIITPTGITAATYVQKRCCRKSRRLIYGPNFVCSWAKLLNAARSVGDLDAVILTNANFGASKAYVALFYARTFVASTRGRSWLQCPSVDHRARKVAISPV